jgi:prepilin-type N-terminal cleavage/methylation domain-containing protein/prepilin-type processing-associated H-X9-DG protein
MKRRGFSLVELLVIIAIIAILAAILFPVLADSKDAAKQAQCIDNVNKLLYGTLLYANDNDGYIVPGAETHGSPFYPAGYQGSIDWALPWNADEYWSALIYPYVKSGEVVGSVQWGTNGEALRILGGAYNCPQFPIQSQSEEYGPHDYLSPTFNNGAVINWNLNEAICPPVSKFSSITSPSNSIYLVEKGSNGPGVDSSYEVFYADESDWSTGVGANGDKDNANLLETQGDCDWPWPWGREPNGMWSTSPCNSMPRFRHYVQASNEHHAWPPVVAGRISNVGYCDGHAKAKYVGSLLWYKNVYQPGIMPAPF